MSPYNDEGPYTDDTAAFAAATKGAAFLDEETPGWASRVDVKHFDMAEGYGCVLGQLYGGYENAISIFDWWQEPHTPAKLGFDHCDAYNYTQLNRAWVRMVFVRQGLAR